MKKFVFTMLTSLAITISLTACDMSSLPSDKNNEDTKEVSSTAVEETSAKSYYTGKDCTNEENDEPAFMVMIENSKAARPQSGLSDADIVFETSAEGGIPRFIALFHGTYPNTIGPVRSVRPYFLNIAKEFNLPVAHCGGSAEALQTIASNNSIESINEISNGSYFWRDNSRKAPHNLYTSSENIKKYIKEHNWVQSKPTFFNFDSSYFNDEKLRSSNNINITINSSYNTSYVYDNGVYKKSMDNADTIDTNTNTALNFSNIIIQKTNITVQSDNNHLNIDQVGEGQGYLISQGKVCDITWKKSSENDRTILYDKDGKEVSLSPGKTIWHIVDKKTKIEL